MTVLLLLFAAQGVLSVVIRALGFGRPQYHLLGQLAFLAKVGLAFFLTTYYGSHFYSLDDEAYYRSALRGDFSGYADPGFSIFGRYVVQVLGESPYNIKIINALASTLTPYVVGALLRRSLCWNDKAIWRYLLISSLLPIVLYYGGAVYKDLICGLLVALAMLLATHGHKGVVASLLVVGLFGVFRQDLSLVVLIAVVYQYHIRQSSMGWKAGLVGGIAGGGALLAFFARSQSIRIKEGTFEALSSLSRGEFPGYGGAGMLNAALVEGWGDAWKLPVAVLAQLVLPLATPSAYAFARPVDIASVGNLTVLFGMPLLLAGWYGLVRAHGNNVVPLLGLLLASYIGFAVVLPGVYRYNAMFYPLLTVGAAYGLGDARKRLPQLLLAMTLVGAVYLVYLVYKAGVTW